LHLSASDTPKDTEEVKVVKSETLRLVLTEMAAVALCVIPQIWGFYHFSKLFYL